MADKFNRTRRLIGNDAVDRLSKARVIVFGIGGVGSYVCEGLARSGVGHITLVDNDDVSETNINRQLPATTKTVGMKRLRLWRSVLRK